MDKYIKLFAIASIGLVLSNCSTIKTLKAPCGPTAGMTDPCGNREPLNGKLNPGVLQNENERIAKPQEADV